MSYNYFDSPIKLFLDLYLAKFLDSLVKPVFSRSDYFLVYCKVTIDIFQNKRAILIFILFSKTSEKSVILVFWLRRRGTIIYQTMHGAIEGTLMQSLWTSLIAHTTQSVEALRCHRNIRMSRLVSSPLHILTALPPSICHMSRISNIIKDKV